MTIYSMKSVEWAEPPEVKHAERVVKAVVGKVGVVDRENEIIVPDSYSVKEVRASSWMHNSVSIMKMMGAVPEVERPVGYGRGWVDGDLIVAEVQVVKTQAGDEFLEHIQTGGSAVGYSHGMEVGERRQRPDGVVELHSARTFEISPVPEPAMDGTGTVKQFTEAMSSMEGANLRSILQELFRTQMEQGVGTAAEAMAASVSNALTPEAMAKDYVAGLSSRLWQ